MAELRKYGVATTILFPLITRDAVDFKTSAPLASGDIKISKDEGAFANTTTTTPTEEGQGWYSIPLTATEMQAARIMLSLIDQTNPKAWEDQAIVIDTYGHASAQHEFDLDLAVQDTNLTKWKGTVPENLTGTFLQVSIERWKNTIPDDLTAGFVKTDVRNWVGSNPNALVSGRVDVYVAAAIAQTIADELLKRAISNVEGAVTWESLAGAVAALTNRRRFNGANLEIYKTDKVTLQKSLAATTDAALLPTKELSP